MPHSKYIISQPIPAPFVCINDRYFGNVALEHKKLFVQTPKQSPTFGVQPKGTKGFCEAKGVQVRFVFRSFIQSDVDSAILLFHKFIMRFSMLLHIRLENKGANPLNTRQKSSQTASTINHLTRFIGPQFTERSATKGRGSFENNDWEMQCIVSMLKSIHSHGALKAINQLPQSTRIRTVTRSPHVFKKTREQFAMVQCKKTLNYFFKSTLEAELFINCANGLKLPAEVQIGLRNL